MATGYCTVDDVRRALRSANLPGDISQDKQIAVDAIAAQTEWFEKTFERHWYVTGGISEDDENLIPTGPNTRDDEHDIPTHGGFVHGASEHDHRRRSANSDALLEAGPRYERHRRHFEHPKEAIRIATGDPTALKPPIDDTVPAYTRIRLARKDVEAVNVLNVINESGGYDDWVADSGFSGGVGNSFRGDDYWVRINDEGVSELYLDVHSMDDDLTTFANAVYVDIDYGHDGLPRTARRGVALRAGAELAEEAVIEIPQNATLYNIETKAEEMRERAADLLEVYRRGT